MSTSNSNATDTSNAWSRLGLIILGFIFLLGGLAVQKQPWVKPEMFSGLDLDLSKVIENIGWFLIFIQVLTIYFYTPLKEAMDTRNKELETTFTEADQLKVRMEEMKSEYEQRLAATEAEARTQIQHQIREAQQLRQTLMGEAAQKADILVAQAEQEIEQEKQRAIHQIRGSVVDLTLQAAEKVLNENIDTDRNRRLVQDFIDKVEVVR